MRLGVAVALGVYVGVLPLYGLHTLICLGLAVPLKLNKITMVLASNISLPIFAPFLVAAGLWIGEFLRFGAVRPLSLDRARDFLATLAWFGGVLPDRFLSCLIGDAVLGVPVALALGLPTWAWARRRARRRRQTPTG